MKERFPRNAWLFAVLLLFAPVLFGQPRDSASSQNNAASMQQALIDLQKAFVSAKERGDADFVRNMLADDFTSIESTGNTTDKMDFVRDIHRPEQPSPAPILYDFKVLQFDERCAVVTYKAVFPDSPLERYRHMSDLWIKQPSGWKLKFEQSTLNLWSAHDLD